MLGADGRDARRDVYRGMAFGELYPRRNVRLSVATALGGGLLLGTGALLAAGVGRSSPSALLAELDSLRAVAAFAAATAVAALGSGALWFTRSAPDGLDRSGRSLPVGSDHSLPVGSDHSLPVGIDAGGLTVDAPAAALVAVLVVALYLVVSALAVVSGWLALLAALVALVARIQLSNVWFAVAATERGALRGSRASLAATLAAVVVAAAAVALSGASPGELAVAGVYATALWAGAVTPLDARVGALDEELRTVAEAKMLAGDATARYERLLAEAPGECEVDLDVEYDLGTVAAAEESRRSLERTREWLDVYEDYVGARTRLLAALDLGVREQAAAGEWTDAATVVAIVVENLHPRHYDDVAAAAEAVAVVEDAVDAYRSGDLDEAFGERFRERDGDLPAATGPTGDDLRAIRAAVGGSAGG